MSGRTKSICSNYITTSINKLFMNLNTISGDVIEAKAENAGDISPPNFAISEPFPPSKNIFEFDFNFSLKSIYFSSFGASTTANTPPNTIIVLPTTSRQPNVSSVKIPAEITPTTISLKYNIAQRPAPKTEGDHMITTPVGIK